MLSFFTQGNIDLMQIHSSWNIRWFYRWESFAKSYLNASHADIQKQPAGGVSRKSCLENMQQIYRRAPMPKLLCNFIEITLQHGCSPGNLLHIFRTPFLKNTSAWLLLNLELISTHSKIDLAPCLRSCSLLDKKMMKAAKK